MTHKIIIAALETASKLSQLSYKLYPLIVLILWTELVAAGDDGSVDDETVTVTPQGAYQSWIHNGLLDALQAAAVAVAKCESVTNTPTCGDSPYYCPCMSTTFFIHLRLAEF